MDDSGSLRAQLGLVAPRRLLRDYVFLAALVVGCGISVALGAMTAEQVGGSISLLAFVSLVIWYPLIEELAFRGVLQGYLRGFRFARRQLAGVSYANLLAAIAFLAWHLIYRNDLMAWFVLIPGLVFGYFRDRHGSLAPSLILHCTYNASLIPGWLLFA